MKTKLLVERYGTWDVNRYSGKTIHTKTNPNALGRDWADDALRKEDGLNVQSQSTYKPSTKFIRYGDNSIPNATNMKSAKWILDIPFGDKDEAKEKFKANNISLYWDKDAVNPKTLKTGSWVAFLTKTSNFSVFYDVNGELSKWTKVVKLLPFSK